MESNKYSSKNSSDTEKITKELHNGGGVPEFVLSSFRMQELSTLKDGMRSVLMEKAWNRSEEEAVLGINYMEARELASDSSRHACDTPINMQAFICSHMMKINQLFLKIEQL